MIDEYCCCCCCVVVNYLFVATVRSEQRQRCASIEMSAPIYNNNNNNNKVRERERERRKRTAQKRCEIFATHRHALLQRRRAIASYGCCYNYVVVIIMLLL
jgi:hypothetical protein